MTEFSTNIFFDKNHHFLFFPLKQVRDIHFGHGRYARVHGNYYVPHWERLLRRH